MSFLAGVLSKESFKFKDETLLGIANQLLLNKSEKLVSIREEKYITLGSDKGFVYRSNNFFVIMSVSGSILRFNGLGQSQFEPEDLIKAYKTYGADKFFNMIEGDYIIAFYEIKTNEVVVARDRLGVYPCFVYNDNKIFSFSTRPRFLFKSFFDVVRPRDEFVKLYAGSHYRFFENEQVKTPFSNIEQIPQAHYLIFKNNHYSFKRYWELPDHQDFDCSLEEMAFTYQQILKKAVKKRLELVNKASFTLSGGMDSSSVLALARQLTSEKQHAFSTTHSDKLYDESDEIKSMLKDNVTNWHQVRIDNPNIPSTVDEIISVTDYPIPTVTWMSHYLLTKNVASLGFDSIFGGLGGDECNAGEFEHFFFYFADLKKNGFEDRLNSEVKGWQFHHDHPIYKKNWEVLELYFKKVIDFNVSGRILPDTERLFSYANALYEESESFKNFKPIFDHPFKSYLKNRVYQDLTRETIPCCLRSEYFNSAHFSLKSFSPFLDHEVIEFAFKVPLKFKYQGGVTKFLLREAMKGILPEETRTRVKKTGWNAPAHVWFSGEGREMLLDLIHSAKFKNRHIYNIKTVNNLILEHDKIVSTKNIKENHMMFFWQLLNLELWLTNLENEKTGLLVE
jgi:asparagine synthase (glutamine-hydrolysing)